MGINGLLPFLKDALREGHLEEYSGQTIAVDAYVWLHKGSYSCALELAEGKATNNYVQFCKKKIDLLLRCGVQPYLVFDGQLLPAKMNTEKERELKRSKSKEEGFRLLKRGQKSAAFQRFQKCIDVTPKMAFEVIKLCKRLGIRYVVAPYEADAQLVFLVSNGLASAALTEDSDLIPFGCETILFKLNNTGDVVEYKRERLVQVTSNGVRFTNWSMEKFRQMCILAGCDYLRSLQGMGIKRAYELFSRYETVEEVVRFLRLSSKWNVPEDYLQNFHKAEAAFRHQRIYDVSLQKVVPLTDFEGGTCEEVISNFIGPELDAGVAYQIAIGDLDPITYKTYQLHTTNCRNERLTIDITPKNKKEYKILAKLKPQGDTLHRFFDSIDETNDQEQLPLTKNSPFKKDCVLNSDSRPYKKTLTHKIKAHEAEEKKNSVTPLKNLQSKLDESPRLNDSLLRHVVDYSFNTCTPAAGQKRKRLTIGLARMKKDPVTSQDTAASREFSALLTRFAYRRS
ncbi:uncharacterized protein LOC135144219 [Zophobas morio]|uniref:uncharacterized protein LOC135144219 n=1 Tax=Zophobas morio TaxID=2755281 RepID=UPI003083A785